MTNTNTARFRAVAVRTSVGLRTLADLTANPTYVGEVSKVVWSDGSESWAMARSYWTGSERVYATIGAGANGRSIVWTNKSLPANVLWR